MKQEDEEAWLDPQADVKYLTKILIPYSSNEMEAYGVSKLVNSPKHDSPDCIEPAVLPPPTTLF